MRADTTIFVLGSFVTACSVQVDRLPSPGETVRARSFTIEPGGKGFNCAVGARLLGAEVDGLLAVGDDLFAETARDALARFGLPHMLVRTGGQTGAGVGFIDDRGENCIAVYPGANDRLAAGHVSAVQDRIARAALIVAQFEIGDAPILSAFEIARGGQIRILNPSPYRAIDTQLLRKTDIVVVNESEADALWRDLTGVGTRNDARLAGRLFELGVVTLVITMGPGGATAWNVADGVSHQPTFVVTPIDTIGAGDAFLAGFAVALHDGLGLREALRQGAACGALTVTRLGVLDALPARPALERLLAGAANAEAVPDRD